MQSVPNLNAWRDASIAQAISLCANQQFAGSRTVTEQLVRDYAAQQGLAFSPTTIYMPHAALRRDMTVAGVSGSQYLVSTDTAAPVDLPSSSICKKLGAQRLDGLRGNVVIPRGTADQSAYWLSDENTVITPGQPELGQISLSPKTCGAISTISRDLNREPAVEAYVRAHLARVIDELIDAAAIAGTGVSGQPMGITVTPGIGTGTVDATDPWGDITAMQQTVAEAGTEPTAILSTPAVRKLLQGRPRFTSTDTPVWDGSAVGGLPAYASTNCPASKLIIGDWSQLLIATWGGIQIDVDPYSLFSTGMIKLRVLVHCDVALLRPSAFAVAGAS